MGKNHFQIKFGYLIILIIAALGLSACNADASASSAAPAVEEVEDAVEEAVATQVPESEVDMNDWDEISLSQDLTLRYIDDGVFEVTHRFPWAANSLLVQMPDGTFVWAGSTYTPAAASLVLRWLDQNYSDYDLVGIITGYHVDNLGGSAALIERGYPVYGSDLTVSLLAEKGEEMREYMVELSSESDLSFYADYHEKIPYLAPTHVFPIDEGLTLEFGGETVRVYYPGPTQAEDKVVVYFPEKKILFGSCMVLGGDEVGNRKEANILSWIQAVARLKQWDLDIVIPGHGDRTDPDLIDHTVNLLDNLKPLGE